MLIDHFGRTIDYLRVSITDLCNLNCIYCWGAKMLKKRDRSWVLSFEEITRIVELAKGLGINRIRITGGEPLVRRGVVDLVKRLVRIARLEVLMTTNGLLLKEYAKDLDGAGLGRLNVSLDSLNEERYRYITQGGSLQDTLTGIDACIKLGFKIRINVVPLSGINEDELKRFIDFGLGRGLDLRFIELMPIAARFSCKGYFIPTVRIKEGLSRFLNLVPAQIPHSGPAEYFQIDGTSRLVGFISPISKAFCKTCNRLRLTADGRLRPCLRDDLEIDLKGPIRSGAGDEDLRRLILKAVESKPEAARMSFGNSQARGMKDIGG